MRRVVLHHRVGRCHVVAAVVVVHAALVMLRAWAACVVAAARHVAVVVAVEITRVVFDFVPLNILDLVERLVAALCALLDVLDDLRLVRGLVQAELLQLELLLGGGHLLRLLRHDVDVLRGLLQQRLVRLLLLLLRLLLLDFDLSLDLVHHRVHRLSRDFVHERGCRARVIVAEVPLFAVVDAGLTLWEHETAVLVPGSNELLLLLQDLVVNGAVRLLHVILVPGRGVLVLARYRHDALALFLVLPRQRLEAIRLGRQGIGLARFWFSRRGRTELYCVAADQRCAPPDESATSNLGGRDQKLWAPCGVETKRRDGEGNAKGSF